MILGHRKMDLVKKGPITRVPETQSSSLSEVCDSIDDMVKETYFNFILSRAYHFVSFFF